MSSEWDSVMRCGMVDAWQESAADNLGTGFTLKFQKLMRGVNPACDDIDDDGCPLYQILLRYTPRRAHGHTPRTTRDFTLQWHTARAARWATC